MGKIFGSSPFFAFPSPLQDSRQRPRQNALKKPNDLNAGGRPFEKARLRPSDPALEGSFSAPAAALRRGGARPPSSTSSAEPASSTPSTKRLKRPPWTTRVPTIAVVRAFCLRVPTPQAAAPRPSGPSRPLASQEPQNASRQLLPPSTMRGFRRTTGAAWPRDWWSCWERGHGNSGRLTPFFKTGGP